MRLIMIQFCVVMLRREIDSNLWEEEEEQNENEGGEVAMGVEEGNKQYACVDMFMLSCW